ncbi:MAG: cheX1 [Clostridiaceae bacterium]|jgi:chemotaxis protein CheX|nr:cheX1 [Clostridiaceae bacterium]
MLTNVNIYDTMTINKERKVFSMNSKYVNIFLKGTQNIFKQVAQMDLNLSGISAKTSPIASKNVVVMVGITGKLKGTVAINMDTELAKNIASNMMGGMPVEELDEMSKSAICELANMIMGTVTTELSGMGVNTDITPPTILTGNNIVLTIAQMPLLSANYKYDNYEVDLDISIKEQ